MANPAESSGNSKNLVVVCHILYFNFHIPNSVIIISIKSRRIDGGTRFIHQ